MKYNSLLDLFKIHFHNEEFKIIDITNLPKENINQFEKSLHSNIISSNYLLAKGYINNRIVYKNDNNTESTKYNPLLLLVPINELIVENTSNMKKYNLFNLYTGNDNDKILFKKYMNYKIEHGLM